MDLIKLAIFTISDMMRVTYPFLCGPKVSAVLSKAGLILDCNILPSDGLSILVSEIKRSDNSPYIAADMLSFNLNSLYMFLYL